MCSLGRHSLSAPVWWCANSCVVRFSSGHLSSTCRRCRWDSIKSSFRAAELVGAESNTIRRHIPTPKIHATFTQTHSLTPCRGGGDHNRGAGDRRSLDFAEYLCGKLYVSKEILGGWMKGRQWGRCSALWDRYFVAQIQSGKRFEGRGALRKEFAYDNLLSKLWDCDRKKKQLGHHLPL